MAKRKPDQEPDDPDREERPEPPPILSGPFDYDEDEDEDDEYEDDDEDEEEDDDDGPRTILITGASGNLATKLIEAWGETYDLLLLDIDPHGREEIVRADLSVFDEEWLRYFELADTVIHLAANPNELATWEELERPNLDAMANVFGACIMTGVERVIFASSNHVMGGYRELGDMPITTDLPPRPGNAYGASKLMGERLGKSLADSTQTTFIALRLGWCQNGRNRPDTLPDDWARSLWLSNGDMVRLFTAAVETDLDPIYYVLNGLSNNRGSRWDIMVTERTLGFVAEDDAYRRDL